ncbi:MAG: pyridoxal phosphate-dependent aminotransferase [Ruminococcaceae bacterium]|nr:pyridoxal phosphate-dependent aminotransferase [Oscillospiraceae bacterium]
MINETMYGLGSKRSVIREIFEFGNRRRAEIGADKVFDFSLGNPSVPAPREVEEAILDLVKNSDPIALHGYTSAQGDAGVRRAIAEDLNARYQTSISPDSIYMTCGAAASLCITLKALNASADDEYITFTPFFPEYRVFVEAAGGRLVAVASDPKDFQIDMNAFEAAITPNTKAVIVNSPNNPSGVVFTAEKLKAACALMKKKSAEYGHPIYLISDEPYRELVYDGREVPFLVNYYENTIVCYSFSKSLSLPGERIGYIALSDQLEEERRIYAAVCGAGRALGYVCAPSMMQRVVVKCLGKTADTSVYKTNRDLLYNALTEYGYTCIYPDGAFYLFVKSPVEDAGAFCMKARDYELLLVPADDFGTPGFVRIAYCVSTEQIQNALPAFKKLMENYQ